MRWSFCSFCPFLQVGKASGQRVVFGTDGDALDPLAALGASEPPEGEEEEDEDEDEEGAAAAARKGGRRGADEGEGLYVVADRPEARFSIAAQLMKQ